jgi:hypothetical protein
MLPRVYSEVERSDKLNHGVSLLERSDFARKGEENIILNTQILFLNIVPQKSLHKMQPGIYNKIGTIIGIIGLILPVTTIMVFAYEVLKNDQSYGFFLSILFVLNMYAHIFVTVPAFIATVIFGILSIMKGNKKKGALFIAAIYVILFLVLVIYFKST